MLKEIHFEFIDPSVEEGDYMSAEDPGIYFNLESPYETLQFLQNPEEIVIEDERITVEVNYPLDKSYMFPLFSPTEKGFSRAELGLAISSLYRWIYDFEEQTSNTPTSNHSGILLNRNKTTGYFGVWGHDLGDLVLSGVRYNEQKKAWVLDIDS